MSKENLLRSCSTLQAGCQQIRMQNGEALQDSGPQFGEEDESQVLPEQLGRSMDLCLLFAVKNVMYAYTYIYIYIECNCIPYICVCLFLY